MAIVDFVVTNYITIIIMVIIIIFALIGRYIEKRGFLAPSVDKEIEKKEFENVEITPTAENVEPTQAVENVKSTPEIVMTPKEEPKKINIEDIDEALFAPIEGSNKYDELNKEVKNLLSKRDVIGDDMLADIDNLSLDKTQRYNFKDIPDLDDVDLPKIKKNDENEDIWKF